LIVEAEKLIVGDLIVLPNESKFLVISIPYKDIILKWTIDPESTKIGLIINCLRLQDNTKCHFEWEDSKKISILRG